MKTLKELFDRIKDEETAILATSADGEVTMRMVSPVCVEDAILIFTSPQSCKYRQLQENPNCCLAVGGFFLQARAEFAGPTMEEKNTDLRSLYCGKFGDAFDDGVEFGGKECDFILLKPLVLSGWSFENGISAPVNCTF